MIIRIILFYFLSSCIFSGLGMHHMKKDSDEAKFKHALIEFFSILYCIYDNYAYIDDNIDALYTQTVIKDEKGKDKILFVQKNIRFDMPETLDIFDARWVSVTLGKSDLATKLKNREGNTLGVLKHIADKYQLNEKSITSILIKNPRTNSVLSGVIKSLIIDCIESGRKGVERGWQDRIIFYLDQVPELRDSLYDMFKHNKEYHDYINVLCAYPSYSCFPINSKHNSINEVVDPDSAKDLIESPLFRKHKKRRKMDRYKPFTYMRKNQEFFISQPSSFDI